MLRHAPVVAVSGLLFALAVGFFPVLVGEPPFTHYPGPASRSSTSARWS